MPKLRIPQKLREQVWIQSMGLKYQGRCKTPWCTNLISVFDFHVAHRVAESKGGPTILENLLPLCARCNTSMGSKSYDEWLQFGSPKAKKPKKAGFAISNIVCCGSTAVEDAVTPGPKRPTISV